MALDPLPVLRDPTHPGETTTPSLLLFPLRKRGRNSLFPKKWKLILSPTPTRKKEKEGRLRRKKKGTAANNSLPFRLRFVVSLSGSYLSSPFFLPYSLGKGLLPCPAESIPVGRFHFPLYVLHFIYLTRSGRALRRVLLRVFR